MFLRNWLRKLFGAGPEGSSEARSGSEEPTAEELAEKVSRPQVYATYCGSGYCSEVYCWEEHSNECPAVYCDTQYCSEEYGVFEEDQKRQKVPEPVEAP